MSQNLRNLLNQAYAAGRNADRHSTDADKRKVIDDLVRRGEGMPVAWEPEFDACSGNQEELAIEFSIEICSGSRPDPVAILEMAEALYRAERDHVASENTEVPA